MHAFLLRVSALVVLLFVSTFSFAQPPGWEFSVPILITDTSGGGITDKQVSFRFDTQTPISLGHMQADASDIRFSTNCAGTDSVEHLVGAYIDTDTTLIYLQIDNIAANDSLQLFMFYGNPTAGSQSSYTIFNGPHSSTDSVIPSSTNNVVSNSSRGFIFSPNIDMIVGYFGKREPTGTTRFVTLWDVATQQIIHQDTVPGGSGLWSYKQLAAPIFLTQGTQYIFSLFQGQGDGYYFGTSTQIGQHLTYGGSMRYCNSCTENTYPTSILNNYHYGVPDFWYYIPDFPTVPPRIDVGDVLLADAGADSSFCAGSGYQMTGNATGGTSAYTYLWSPGTSVSDSTMAMPTFTGTGNTALSFTVTDANGCHHSDSVALTVLIAPVVNLGNDTAVCAPSSVTLDAGAGGGSYLWSNGDTSQTTTVTSSGTYSVIVTGSNGCPTNDSIDVAVNAQPNVDLGPDTTVCAMPPATLDAGAGFSSYAWNTGANTQTITITASGAYAVMVTDSNGCTNNDSVNLTVQPNPVPNIGQDTSVCPGTPVVLDANGPGFSYLWSTGSTTDTINVLTSGTYAVTVTDPFGCSGSDTVFVDTCLLINITPGILGDYSLDIYPNPGDHNARITLQIPVATRGTLEMRDLNGRVVRVYGDREWVAGAHTLDLNAPKMADGIYFLRFTADNVNLLKKFMLTR